MRIDPLLLPVLAGYDQGDGSDVAAERVTGDRTARAMAGWLTRAAPASVDVRDTHIPGGPPVPVRIYTPTGSGPRGGLLFAHGGGWATGSPATAHEHCSTLAADAGVVVVSVDYRLVPENPFPAGLDDMTRALDWLLHNASSLGVDPGRLAIGGESAGANLAAVVAQQRADAVAVQLLEVPVLDLTDTATASGDQVARDFPALDAMRRVVTRRYLAAGADPLDPRVSPLLTRDLTGAPPALLLAADVDPWRDDALRYAAALSATGTRARVRVFEGIVHGTQSFTELLPAAREWHTECVTALRTMTPGEVVT